MGLSRSWKRAGLVAVVAAGLWSVLPGAAPGAKRYDDCPKKTLCVYSDNGFTGVRLEFKSRGVSNKLAREIDDEASSVQNHRGTAAFLYTKKDGKGVAICIAPHSYESDLAARNFNDKASSSRISKKDHCPGGPV